jgi:chorismate synthase
MRLRLSTAGESHGPALCGILDGLPHGLPLDRATLDEDLRRRQSGFGRSGRQKIEADELELIAGVRGGRTIGAPVAFLVRNRDHASWADTMAVWGDNPAARPLSRPRPGHADLAGALKLELTDARDVLERASARSTAVRVAGGALCKALLRQAGIELFAHVVRIGEIAASPCSADLPSQRALAEANEVRCVDAIAAAAMVVAIESAQRDGDSLGGVAEVIAEGVPAGLGSHAEWDQRLDGRLAQAALSIQSCKAVEVGLGAASAMRRGSQVHDPIGHDGARFVRSSNHAGGIEGGISNGERVVLRAAFKPIPTLARPLPSVDLISKQPSSAHKERTDACAVPAAAIVLEAAIAFVLADALLDKTGGDSLVEVLRNLGAHRDAVRRL